MNKKEKDEFIKQKKAAYKKARTFGLFLFVAVMTFCCILGLMLPIRPKESALEKRELAKFPTFSISGVMDGSYFSDISTWYSDSYPLRDVWMTGSNAMKKLYGIKTKQVISNKSTSDEIPVVTKTESDETVVETSNETATVASAPAESAESVAADLSMAESVESVAADSSVAESTGASVEAPAPIVLPTDDPSYSLPAITGQTLNGVYVEGDTGYGMYFFNQQAATTYIDLVNRTADIFAGVANVYTMLVPNSEYFYLTDEQRVQLEPDWRNEKAAADYYAASFNSNVTNINICDVLAAHSGEYIYFRTDHHWTGLGAYYAYTAWAQVKGVNAHSLGEYECVEYPGFTGSYYTETQSAAMEANPDTVIAYKPLTCDRMTFTSSDGNTLSWPIINDVSSYRNTQKYSCFAAGDNPFSYIENSNVANGQACIVIKESYADAFIPYLTDHYQFIYWFDYREYNGSITDYIRTVSQTEGINTVDVLFLNGLDPISSIDSMNRLNSLMQ